MTDAPAFDPEALVSEVSFSIFAESGENETAETFAALDAETREQIDDISRAAIQTFTAAIKRMGVRLLPPGAVAVPKSEQEAAAMAGMAREFFEAQTRKPKLVGCVSPGLVLPKGINGRRTH